MSKFQYVKRTINKFYFSLKLYPYLFLFIFVLSFTSKLFAQKEPSWIFKTPNSNYYIYTVGTAYGSSAQQMRKKALTDAVSQLALKQEITVQGVQELKSLTIENQDQFQSIDSLTNEITIKYSDNAITDLQVIDQYINQGETTAYILVRLKKENINRAWERESSRIESERKKVLARAFLYPGYGHSYMGYEGKAKLWGYSFGAATILGGLGYVSSIYFENKATTENQINRKNYFNQISQKFYYSSLTLFGVAGAIYVTNILAAKIKAKNFFGNSTTVTANLSLDKNYSTYYSAKIKSKVCPQLNIQISF